MSSSIYYRIFGQGLTLSMHATNSLVLFLAMQNEDLMKDPDIKKMTSLQGQYLTVWNIGFQLAYFSLAFACDFLTVTGRDNLIPKRIRLFRQTFFASVIFPVAVLIFTLFWPIFIYDRELLYPEFIDNIFSFKSNLAMHFFILPAAFWELVFLPPQSPRSHVTNLRNMVILFIIYNVVILHTYYQRGHFPYPILHMTIGTIYYPMLLFTVFCLILAIYAMQCKLTNLVWGEDQKKKVKFS